MVAGLAIEATRRAGSRSTRFGHVRGSVGTTAGGGTVYLKEERVSSLAEPGDEQPRWHRVESGWALRWIAAEFLVSADASFVEARVLEGVPDDIVDHLIADHVVPRLLTLRGRTVFHGTAVSIEGQAVAFLGSTGAGKSTLAVTCANAFGALLADDCLVIEEHTDPMRVVPTSALGRLRSDAASIVGIGRPETCAGKTLIACEAESRPVPLAAIVLLDRGATDDSISLTRVGPARAMMGLGRHRFTFEDDAVAASGVLAAQRCVVEAVPVWSLRYPTDLAALPAVHHVLLDLIRSDAANGICHA